MLLCDGANVASVRSQTRSRVLWLDLPSLPRGVRTEPEPALKAPRSCTRARGHALPVRAVAAAPFLRGGLGGPGSGRLPANSATLVGSSKLCFFQGPIMLFPYAFAMPTY